MILIYLLAVLGGFTIARSIRAYLDRSGTSGRFKHWLDD